jgi:hypothetical protein
MGRGVNIPWMKIDPRVNLPWGSKYHMIPEQKQLLNFIIIDQCYFIGFEN